MSDDLKSKVLVYEPQVEFQEFLRGFFEEHHLSGLRADSVPRLWDVLQSNVDLGAVFVCEADESGAEEVDVIAIITQVNMLRPELPIFLRCTTSENTQKEEYKHRTALAYFGEASDSLNESLHRHLFNRFYPSELIRAIEKDTRSALDELFPDFDIVADFPYLIHDRILHGEVFSLMRLEADWCRGYMMLETDEGCILDVIAADRIPSFRMDVDDTSYRAVNQVVSELTNSIWGKLKASVLHSNKKLAKPKHRTEVPSVVNHTRNYISFGTTDPKLCFQYVLTDKNGDHEPFNLTQRFVFHLKWTPEDLSQPAESVNEMVNDGGLVFL